MAEFISLREFLLLRESFDGTYPRPAHRGELLLSRTWRDSGEDFVKRYDIAKLSFEKYGVDGPPVGSKVFTLYGGHGGGVFCKRTFAGINKDDDRFFSITRIENEKESISLVERPQWWVYICTAEILKEVISELDYKRYIEW